MANPKLAIRQTDHFRNQRRRRLTGLQNLQRSALTDCLVLSLAACFRNASLVGQGMDATELLNHLYQDLITTPKELDLSQKSLQLHFVTQLKLLLEEEKLNPKSRN